MTCNEGPATVVADHRTGMVGLRVHVSTLAPSEARRIGADLLLAAAELEGDRRAPVSRVSEALGLSLGDGVRRVLTA